MSTRYIDRSALAALLSESDDPLAERARSALVPSEPELLPVHVGGLDLRTYEVRLARAEAGNGPSTAGLREFVATLKVPKADPEYLSFHGDDGTFFLVLLDVGRAVAITAVESA